MATEKKTVHIDEDAGKDDSSATGTQEAPFKSLQFAYIQTDGQQEYVTKKAPAEGADATATTPEWTPASKAGLKKAVSALQAHKKKEAKATDLAERSKKEADARQKVLEDAKQIVIKEDKSLPAAKRIRLNNVSEEVKLKKQDSDEHGTRVKVLGRVHHVRKQKDICFVELKDGYGKMQCLFQGDLAKSYDILTLTNETSMELYGQLYELPAGAKAPLNRELHVDYFFVQENWKAPGGADAITTRVAPDADAQTKMNLRHLTLRGDTASSILVVRDAVEFAFNSTYKELKIRKVSPPALVQTMVEGGATLFGMPYYDETAYLTQSSQLYLETVLASLGDVYCIEKSFRAEKSLTRRHLSEYTHVEAELDYITFEDLLNHIELMVTTVIRKVLDDPEIAAILKKLNPDFEAPSQPFMRLDYKDAIKWLNEHEIPNEDGKPHEFGDDIAEAAERKMTDAIGKPIFLTYFPAELKSFYMPRAEHDNRVTESVDLLIPGVGEIVGGSMRIYDYEELLAGYKRVGIEPGPYYWYTDQRRYGSSPHGGYGLGLERFLAYMCNQFTVRDTCMYPRFMGRCTP